MSRQICVCLSRCLVLEGVWPWKVSGRADPSSLSRCLFEQIPVLADAWSSRSPVLAGVWSENNWGICESTIPDKAERLNLGTQECYFVPVWGLPRLLGTPKCYFVPVLYLPRWLGTFRACFVPVLGFQRKLGTPGACFVPVLCFHRRLGTFDGIFVPEICF